MQKYRNSTAVFFVYIWKLFLNIFQTSIETLISSFMMSSSKTDTDKTVLGDEEDTSRSLAATLRLAAAKGYLDKDTKRKPIVVVNSAKRAKLETRSYTIEEKREERRDYRHRSQQLHEVKEPEDYKPEINLEYTDDSGRKLETPKEQFKQLCYKFHGKGPGKNKIDKRLRKQELESKAKSVLATNIPPTSAALMLSKQKELKSPFVILSKGK